MELELDRFFEVCNPSWTLEMGNPKDRPYYIDFSSVRGGKIIEELSRTITRLSPNNPTCQLFTGHIGCGKSTELLRLKAELEQQGFHVVFFEAGADMDIADVDVTDILLAIAHQISDSIEQVKISVKPRGFKSLLQGLDELLQTKIEWSAEASLPGIGQVIANTENGEVSLALGLGKITAKAKDSIAIRNVSRQYLEPRTNVIIEAINQDLILPAIEQLKKQGKKGLVVIIDDLDRVNTNKDRNQPQYLFVERGEQLNKLKCHIVYTIPLVLTFSNDLGSITNRFGVDPKVLPMVPVQLQNSNICPEGMDLLRQMVLTRAFPEVEKNQRYNLIAKLFDTPETLDRLCSVSGGHVRNLLVMLYRCLQKDDPPLSRECLETVIKQRCNELNRALTDDEWDLLREVAKSKDVRGEDEYHTLLRSLFVFEYRDKNGSWFDINPILIEAKEFQQ